MQIDFCVIAHARLLLSVHVAAYCNAFFLTKTSKPLELHLVLSSRELTDFLTAYIHGCLYSEMGTYIHRVPIFIGCQFSTHTSLR